MTLARLTVPQDWRNAEPFYRSAAERVRTALADPRTPERLTRYYNRGGDFAGASFLGLGENDPARIGEADLLAATLLEAPVSALMARALLKDGPTRDRVHELLSPERLPLDARLEDVTPPVLAAMDELYTTLRAVVPPPTDRYQTGWTTAAKICARKRPDLFPVRDEVVCRYLGLWPSRYQVDWQVFHTVMADPRVRDELDRLVSRADESDTVDVGRQDARLRHLDVVLWMHAPRR
ncbi:DUF6308 family protein [Agilicoccus flavus]|uniref:DUF6308 family protein n=1 Tax=Agilicoccus flavus TaxID=2775968 RepID=UPI001CF6AF10|nr:DUF6308 family protein [Agilicoccus flavus]